MDKLEEELMNDYKNNISLDMTNKNIEIIKDDINQLKRLLNCVHTLKYKLALIHKVWLFVSDKNNNVYCYNIKEFNPVKFKYMYVMIDLETFLTNNSINTDIEKIQNGISNTIDRTGKKMLLKMNQLYPLFKNIDDVTLKIENKKNIYKKYEEEFSKLLNIIVLNETKLIERLNLISNRSVGSGINRDLERTNLDKELLIIKEHKNEIIGKLINIKEKTRDLMLIYDTIVFESIILIKKIIDNVKKLNEIIK
jgi:hypothetical protein